MSAYSTEVGALSLYDAEAGVSLDFERDRDLSVNLKEARRGGDAAAFVLVELGIDGNAAHHARLDFGCIFPSEGEDRFHYSLTGDEVRALTDAIDTLTILRDRLAHVTA